MIMPSVVERVFRPRRNALVDHYLDAYTTAFDALMERHAYTNGQDDDEDEGDGLAAQLVPRLHVQVNENGERQEQSACSTEGTLDSAFPIYWRRRKLKRLPGWT